MDIRVLPLDTALSVLKNSPYLVTQGKRGLRFFKKYGSDPQSGYLVSSTEVNNWLNASLKLKSRISF